VVLGYFDVERKAYLRLHDKEQAELLSLTGNLARYKGEPFFHVHVALMHPYGRNVMYKLNGLRVAVLASDGFEEPELTQPVAALRQGGAEAITLSPRPGEIQGVRHDLDKTITVGVDRTLDGASAEEFDAVLLPGGTVNADSMRAAPEVQAFLQAMQRA